MSFINIFILLCFFLVNNWIGFEDELQNVELENTENKKAVLLQNKKSVETKKGKNFLAGKIYITSRGGLDENCQEVSLGTDNFQIILFINNYQFIQKVYSCCHFDGETPNEKINKGTYSIKEKRLILNFEPQSYVIYNQKLKGKIYYRDLAVQKTEVTTAKFEILYCKGKPYFKELEGLFQHDFLIEANAEDGALSKFDIFLGP
jgi:hypothetical protein